MNTILRDVMKDSIRNDLTEFDIGDTIRVGISIKDGDKQRIQYVEGIVIRKRNNKKRRNENLPKSINENFTIKCTYGNVAVERMFFINSPIINNIKIVKRGKVRRAKLYYLRTRSGKANKVKVKLTRSKLNS